MNKIRLQIILTILVLTGFSSCDRDLIYEKYESISENGWHKDSLVVFNIPVTDTLQNHNLYINVRNDIKYKYSNLWLFIEINQPGETGVADTFELMLADPKGKWLGDGFGGIKTQQIKYKSGVYFPVSGEYTINIQHGMRDEILTRITDIGFRIEKVAD